MVTSVTPLVGSGKVRVARGRVGVILASLASAVLMGAAGIYRLNPLADHDLARASFVLCSDSISPASCLPAISSTCIAGGHTCTVAVAGGQLTLEDIKFPGGPEAPGTAAAWGFVNGKFVSGHIALRLPDGAGDNKSGNGTDAHAATAENSNGAGAKAPGEEISVNGADVKATAKETYVKAAGQDKDEKAAAKDTVKPLFL